MIPVRTEENEIVVSVKDLSSKTYKMNFNEKVYGKIDRLEAMEQAVLKILNTERYNYQIYSWSYGIEISDLIGKPKNYVKVVIVERIKEALLQDERVIAVESFLFKDIDRRSLEVSFEVSTIFGDFKTQKVVLIWN